MLGTIYRIIFRFRVYGRQNLPKMGERCIVCSNHQSNNDVIALGMALYKLKPVFMAKKELFENKLLSWLLRKFNPIPVDRKNPGTGPFKKVIQALKENKVFAIFIQGTRKKELLYDDAKNGVALFVVKGESPVIPIHINATFKLFSKIEIYIGEPIHFSEYFGKKVKTDDLEVISGSIMQAIMTLPERAKVAS